MCSVRMAVPQQTRSPGPLTGVVEAALGDKIVRAEARGCIGGAACVEAWAIRAARIVRIIGRRLGPGRGRPRSSQVGVDRIQ